MASIHLSILYQDHMLLQREKPLTICGRADAPLRQITVVLGDVSASAPVQNGAFSCVLPPQPAGEELTLSFYGDGGKTPLAVFSHVSLGDIWMACGQSNMEFFLRYDAHWNDTRVIPRNPGIHMFNVPRIAYQGQKRVQPECGRWFLEGDPAWPLFSAPGYSFARSLQPFLKAPVGIIGCNWGGTPASSWMEEESLSKPPLDIFLKEYQEAASALPYEELKRQSQEGWAFEDSYRHQLEWRAMMYGLTWEEQLEWQREHSKDPVLPMGPWHQWRPCGLYHTMLKQLAGFSIKGILWYQGESDSGHADIYDQTLTALIRSFRTLFQDPQLPFLMVQLAPFGKWLDCTGENYTLIRQMQEKVSRAVPGCHMVSIMDLGSYEDIHPKHKMEIGRRLALMARGEVYHEKVLCHSPELFFCSRKGNTITLTFRHARGGLFGDPSRREAFRISPVPLVYPFSEETPLIPIKSMTIHEDRLFLTLENAPRSPLYLSFAQEDYCEVHLWNKAGLPIRPFSCQVPL
ncbi:MAG: sialate O-acetylesterase [Eubacteriales bacterium]|nr:sialate O-acetylesterase [Eubacteriales bacterium]